jgi:hypothetical protein
VTLSVEPVPGADFGADEPARIVESVQVLTKLCGAMPRLPPGKRENHQRSLPL